MPTQNNSAAMLGLATAIPSPHLLQCGLHEGGRAQVVTHVCGGTGLEDAGADELRKQGLYRAVRSGVPALFALPLLLLRSK